MKLLRIIKKMSYIDIKYGQKFFIKTIIKLERHGRAFFITQRAFTNVTIYVSCTLSILFLILECTAERVCRRHRGFSYSGV